MADVCITSSRVPYVINGSGISFPMVSSPCGETKQFITAQFPALSSIFTREETFRNWPTNKHQTPLELAKAGFFYAGFSDCTRCFCCGIGLRNWLPGDSPRNEHAHWSPMCDFVKLMREDNSTRYGGSLEVEGYHTTGRGTSNTPPNPDNAAIVESVLKKPCTASLVILGFSLNVIKRAVKIVLAESDWNEWQVTTSRLAEVVLDITEEGTNSTADRGFSDEVIHTQRIGEGLSDDDFMTSSIELERLRLIEENERLRHARTCKVCQETDVSVVFMPCRHLVTCPDCSACIEHCVLCQQPINARVKVYT
ncbi:baculoviral IAP repeat-containing protein 2-like isoform X2 [Liolophura sinensis]